MPSVIKTDPDTNRIVEIDTRVWWNFDAFLADLLVHACKEFRTHEKHSFPAIVRKEEGDSSLYDQETKEYKEAFKRVQTACQKYLDQEGVDDEKKLKKYQAAVVEISEWLPTMWT